MPQLTAPAVRVHRSYLAAVAEYAAEGRGSPGDNSMLGREIRQYGGTWADPGAFAAYTARLRADAREESPRPEWLVPATTLWWAEGSEYLGRITVRHRLTPRLLEMGGHIGYDVRPSARRRGHATRMLAAVLPVARSLGIESALVTCDEDNTGSRKVIEANGGVFEDSRSGKRRYWVPTRPAERDR
jgi:predicted acetyltransferase